MANEAFLLMLQITKKKPEYGSVIKFCMFLFYWRKMESDLWILLYLGFFSTISPCLMFYSPQEKAKLLFSVLIKRSQKSKYELKIWVFFWSYSRIIPKSGFHCNQCMAVIIFNALVVGWFFLNNMWKLIFSHHIFHMLLPCLQRKCLIQ